MSADDPAARIRRRRSEVAEMLARYRQEREARQRALAEAVAEDRRRRLAALDAFLSGAVALNSPDPTLTPAAPAVRDADADIQGDSVSDPVTRPCADETHPAEPVPLTEIAAAADDVVVAAGADDATAGDDAHPEPIADSPDTAETPAAASEPAPLAPAATMPAPTGNRFRSLVAGRRLQPLYASQRRPGIAATMPSMARGAPAPEPSAPLTVPCPPVALAEPTGVVAPPAPDPEPTLDREPSPVGELVHAVASAFAAVAETLRPERADEPTSSLPGIELAEAMAPLAEDPALTMRADVALSGEGDAIGPPPALTATGDVPETSPAAAALADPPAAAAADAAPTGEPDPEPATLADTAHDAAAETRAARAAADLSTLGLIGPGMRLRLRQGGIGTVGALAHAEPDRLRATLGEVSRLARIEDWVAAARRHLDPEPKDAAP